MQLYSCESAVGCAERVAPRLAGGLALNVKRCTAGLDLFESRIEGVLRVSNIRRVREASAWGVIQSACEILHVEPRSTLYLGDFLESHVVSSF